MFNLYSYQTLPLLFNFQHQGLFKVKESKNPFSFGTAEKKLLIVFFYYLALNVLGFLIFSLFQRSAVLLQRELQRYFVCESQGYKPDSPCDRSRFERLGSNRSYYGYGYPTISIIATNIVLLAPVVNFVFVVNIQLLKEKFTAFRTKITSFFTKSSIS